MYMRACVSVGVSAYILGLRMEAERISMGARQLLWNGGVLKAVCSSSQSAHLESPFPGSFILGGPLLNPLHIFVSVSVRLLRVSLT